MNADMIVVTGAPMRCPGGTNEWVSEPGDSSPTHYAHNQGLLFNGVSTATKRKSRGQFFTHPDVARFMARMALPIRTKDVSILDPGAGTGILTCAMCEEIIHSEYPVRSISVDVYENDPALVPYLKESLEFLHAWLKERDVEFTYTIHCGDSFVLDVMPGGLFSQKLYDIAIGNPPYKKIRKDDPQAVAASKFVYGQPNIYALFMGVAAELLHEDGVFVFITPRSYTSGAYFAKFRHEFLKTVSPEWIHVFESRREAFRSDDVLQETIILKAKRSSDLQNDVVILSSSEGVDDLTCPSVRVVPSTDVLIRGDDDIIISLPTTREVDLVRRIMRTWDHSLDAYGLKISTGPVVAFRNEHLLRYLDPNEAHPGPVTPLLWLTHVRTMAIEWPSAKWTKNAHFIETQEAHSNGLLVADVPCILLRRFSSKEEKRRLVAAPLLEIPLKADSIGLENHLNYIYRPGGKVVPEEAIGLAALLNSELMDIYFRASNGNTQVNATELRNTPLPSMTQIIELGNRVSGLDDPTDLSAIDQLVWEMFLERKDEATMAKIDEARTILAELGLPTAQQNELSALTLLALAGLGEEDSWTNARAVRLRIHDILVFAREHYQRDYAENTRETVRRQVIHQFEQAGVVVRNPDEPELPTNSPRTHYALSDSALRTIRTYGTSEWEDALERYREEGQALAELYRMQREQVMIPLTLPNGDKLTLSPGDHNQLQVDIVNEFGPRFAPGGKLVYLGDTARKDLYTDAALLSKLRIPVTQHDKLPDVLIYVEDKNWLYLIEAVTSHGPVSPKRYFELEEMLKDCPAGRVYVSSFPDFNEFKRHLTGIAWETEVWVAEIPDHLIHFNGDRFLGPRED